MPDLLDRENYPYQYEIEDESKNTPLQAALLMYDPVKYYHYLTIVQSSGYGKTKMCLELLQEHYYGYYLLCDDIVGGFKSNMRLFYDCYNELEKSKRTEMCVSFIRYLEKKINPSGYSCGVHYKSLFTDDFKLQFGEHTYQEWATENKKGLNKDISPTTKNLCSILKSKLDETEVDGVCENLNNVRFNLAQNQNLSLPLLLLPLSSRCWCLYSMKRRGCLTMIYIRVMKAALEYLWTNANLFDLYSHTAL